VELIYEYFK